MRFKSTTVVAAMLLVAPLVGVARGYDGVRPRVVEAKMRDLDSDGRADRVVLRYSEPVRHRRDADERYPFSVEGYDIWLVRAARGSPWLVIEVEEKADPDPAARPVVAYRHTRRGAVRDLSSYQAVEQTLTDVLPSLSWLRSPSGAADREPSYRPPRASIAGRTARGRSGQRCRSR